MNDIDQLQKRLYSLHEYWRDESLYSEYFGGIREFRGIRGTLIHAESSITFTRLVPNWSSTDQDCFMPRSHYAGGIWLWKYTNDFHTKPENLKNPTIAFNFEFVFENTRQVIVSTKASFLKCFLFTRKRKAHARFQVPLRVEKLKRFR